MIKQTLFIPEDYKNQRLDQALAKLLPDFSRTQIREWIDAGMVQLNQQDVKGKTKVKGGETITINATVKEQPAWLAQKIPLNIVFQDEALLIINKPPGLVVHPGAGNPQSTLLNALIYEVPQLKELPRAGILHRLDKDTSGLLVIAKTPQALKSLSQQLKTHSMVREYQAIVCGRMISGGTVDAPIGRHYLQRKRMAVTDEGKPAVTHYRVAEKYRAHSRLKVTLETGRTHQIRVHMTHIHHPVVGDKTYGGRVQIPKGASIELATALRGFKRQALHAFAITLAHPVSREIMRFEIDLPEDIQGLIEVLRKDCV